MDSAIVNDATAMDTMDTHGNSPEEEDQLLLGSDSASRKRNAARSRVTRACDRCKKKKIRCTGAKPCEICIQAGTSCSYNASYARGRKPAIPTMPGYAQHRPAPGEPGVRPAPSRLRSRGSVAESDSMDMSVQGMAGPTIPSEQQPHHETLGPSSHVASTTVMPQQPVLQETPRLPDTEANGQFVPQSSKNSPEPSQTDRQGHYVGPASGVSFLLRVQKRLHQALTFSHGSSIFTFGDAPLPEFDPTFFVMPSREEAQHLVDRYFDFAVPTHRFLHRPTINGYVAEFYETMGSMRGDTDSAAKTALLFMVLAQAREYMPSSTTSDLSARYFQMAEHQIGKERGEVRLVSVQARLCQCFYLLSLSRINHCWSLFGTMAHLALAIGLNRNRRVDSANGYNVVEVECRKRVFWCAYSLDNYLSAALGRPRTFHDKDIDVSLPSCIEDEDLHPSMGQVPPPGPLPRRAHSLMLAAVAHVKLSRIVSQILDDLYPIRPLSTVTRSKLTLSCSEALDAWHEEMARFLDSNRMETALLLPIYQRQRNVLSLAFWHATILTHRPFLLSSFASLQQNSGADGERAMAHRAQIQVSVKTCLDAAMSIVGLVDELVHAKQMFRAFWFTSYFAFCAVVVLYVFVIQQSFSAATNYGPYLDAAMKCQDQLSSLASKDSLAHRYCLVLEEFRLEVLRRTDASQRPDTFATQPGANDGQQGLAHVQGLGAENVIFDQSGSVDTIVDFNYSPSSSLADMTSWGNFDSMVTSGFGQLEALLNNGGSFGF